MPKYDYTYLEGRTLKVAGYKEVKEVTVSGCEYDIGIAMQLKGDPRYFLCLVSPTVFSKKYKKKAKLRQHEYRKLFLGFIKAIRAGKISRRGIFELSEAVIGTKPKEGVSAETCPFT